MLFELIFDITKMSVFTLNSDKICFPSLSEITKMSVCTLNSDKICFPVYRKITKMTVFTQNSDKICLPGLSENHQNERVHAKYRQNLLPGSGNTINSDKNGGGDFTHRYASAAKRPFLHFFTRLNAFLRCARHVNFCRYLRCF